MKPVTICGLVAVCVSPLQPAADASVLFVDWADEFLAGVAECDVLSNGCLVLNHWNGTDWVGPNTPDPQAPPRWTYIGQQGGNAQGRANARSKVMTRFRDMDSAHHTTMVTTLSRWRTLSIPAEGSSCSKGTFVGSSQYVVDSTDPDFRINNRLLPVMDFSAETATGGTNVGYEEDLSVTTGGGSATKSGCFKIRWN